MLDLRLPHAGGVELVRAIRKIDGGRLPILVFSGTIASAEEVRDLAALGVAGYVNEYSAVQHILPSLAPHLFPDNFNRRGSPRVVLGIPVAYRFGNTIAAALTLNLSKGGVAIRTMSPLEQGCEGPRAVPAARARSVDIEAESRVAWSDRRVGMGLQFEKVEPADQAGDRRVRRSALLHEPESVTAVHGAVRTRSVVRIAHTASDPASHSLSSRSAFAMTISDAPMSATTAIHSVALPTTASTRNAAFSTSEKPMFARMLRTVARLRRSA